MTFFNTKPTTVDAAIAPLLQAASDLEGVAELCFERITANKELIARLAVQNVATSKEHDHASDILTALRNITEPKE